MHFTVVSRKGGSPCLSAPAVAESRPRRVNICQGHEQKLRKDLEEKVGGLPLLASLVKVTQMYAQDRMSLDGLGRLVRLIYQKN